MFNDTVVTKYSEKLKNAVRGTTMFYAYAYNDGPDIGMRQYGDENHSVKDVLLEDGTLWLIAGDVFNVFNGHAERLNSCRKVAEAPVENLVVDLRAQGMIDGVIDVIPLGLHLVSGIEILREDFGLLKLR